MARAYAGGGAGHAVLGREQLALRVQHGLKVHQTAGVLLLRQQGRVARGIGRGVQARQPLALALQRHQRVLHILERAQHRLFIARAALLQRGLLRAHLGAQRATIKHRQRHAGQQRCRRGAAARERPQGQRAQAQRATNAQAGQALGLGLGHALPGGAHAVFGLAHIGALAQGIGGKGQRQVGRRQRHGGGGRQGLVQRRGRATGEHGQRMARLGHGRAQRGQLGGRLLDAGARLLLGQRIRQARLHAPLGDLRRLALRGQVALGNRQALLLAAQVDVVHRHLGRQRHPGRGQAGLGGQQVGVASAYATANAAKQVGLPARVQPRLEAVGCIAAAAAALGRSGPIHRRQQARGLHVALGARLLHGGARAAHAGVGLQRLVDQASELGVAQLLPPLGQVVWPGRSLRGWPIRPGCGCDHRAAQRLGWTRSGAAGQRQGQQRRQSQRSRPGCREGRLRRNKHAGIVTAPFVAPASGA